MFDTENPEEMQQVEGWRKWVTFDALLLFFGITMLVTISSPSGHVGGPGESGRGRR